MDVCFPAIQGLLYTHPSNNPLPTKQAAAVRACDPKTELPPFPKVTPV